jgi:hypothetical protein
MTNCHNQAGISGASPARIRYVSGASIYSKKKDAGGHERNFAIASLLLENGKCPSIARI